MEQRIEHINAMKEGRAEKKPIIEEAFEEYYEHRDKYDQNQLDDISEDDVPTEGGKKLSQW